MSHRVGLDQASVVEAAVKLVDEEGIEQRGHAPSAIQESGLAEPPERHLSGSGVEPGEPLHQRLAGHRPSFGCVADDRSLSYEPAFGRARGAVRWNEPPRR